MTAQQPPGAPKAPQSKYTLLLDPATRAYQRKLRGMTNINMSDLLRAAIARIASDPELEAELFAACGGGYYPPDDPADGFWGVPTASAERFSVADEN